MDKKEYIVFKYKNRDEIINKAGHEFLDYVYALSYPQPEKSWSDMIGEIPAMDKKTKKYKWPLDFFYIPDKVLLDIYNNWKETYSLINHWENNIDFLLKCFTKEPGMHDTYNDHQRTCTQQRLIKDLIGPENSKRIINLLEGYRNFYKFNLRDINVFANYFMATPCSNRETVIKAWKETFGKDIEIPDDDMWISEYDFDDLLEK